MFGDIQTRADRMKRLPPVTPREYVEPVLYVAIALPFIWATIIVIKLATLI